MQRLPTPDLDPHRTLRSRFTDLGAIAWRISDSAAYLEAPGLAAPAVNLLQGSLIVSRLREQAEVKREKEDTTPFELMPGCVVSYIPLRHRRVITAWTVLMFMRPDFLQSSAFEQACGRALIDVTAARKILSPLAIFTDEEIGRLSLLAAQSATDLESANRASITLDGFSQTLADAYEHIELMHALARGMRKLDDPMRFVDDSLRGILEATPFTWVAMMLSECPWDRASTERMVLRAGNVPVEESVLMQFAGSLLDEQGSGEGALIISDERVEQIFGATDQVVALPVERDDRTVGVLLAGGKEGLDPQVSTYDTRVIDAVGAFAGTFFENTTLVHEQQATFVGALRAVTAAVDAKDSYTRGHSDRVAHVAARLAAACGLNPAEVERIHLAGLVHDVGKIGVPEAVLCKPGRLTDEEFDQIKKHPRMGHEILQGIPQLSDILPGVLWHHERWDGRGYPDGIAGEDIPMVARLIAVADTFDAMSSNRSYRPAMPRSEILEEIRKCAGSQFDPELVPAFLSLEFSEYDRLVIAHAPQRRIGPNAAAA